MRAAVLYEHGAVENLKIEANYREPKAGDGEVVVKVKASSLNYHDVFTCRGMPGIKVPLPIIPGLDVAGEVAELGKGVTGWKVGDPVLVNPIYPGKGLMGEMLDGGLAEYCVCAAEQLIRIPAGVTYAQAASLPVAYGTAHRMMFANGSLQGGEKVLILGASGGVGTCCVILAKMMGCEVVVASGDDAKLERLKGMGADHGIYYDQFERKIWELYGKPHRRTYDGGVDMVVNFTGGDTWVPSMKACKRGGKILTCGATAGFDPTTDLRYIWTFELKILGSNSWAVSDLEALMQMISDGRMAPIIDTELPIEESVAGIKLLEDRQVFGKVIISP
jgi:2-desacetyl-2-hydroxyethyl bacteriochlorophyllide A dehydrogenase